MSFKFIMTVPMSFIFIAFCLFFICSHGCQADNKTETVNIGAIIDGESREGKEMKTAMKIAVENFNKNSTTHKLALNIKDSGKNPLQTAFNADKLIKEKQVQVILGTDSWDEAVLVADVGTRSKVPVLSFAGAAITTPLLSTRWPFLVQMASNASEEMRCVSGIVGSHNWRQVIAIYELDAHGGDSGLLSVLSEALQHVGSEIEYSLAFPPISSLSDPNKVILEELEKLQNKKSRIFVLLRSSMSLASYLFPQVNKMGLIGRDTAWIVTETIAGLLNSLDSSVISSMQGALGIKAYYPRNSISHRVFRYQFRKILRAEYPEEDNFEPGIHAFRAYDAVSTIIHALGMLHGRTSTSALLLKSILASDFNGLSGKIQFRDGRLASSPIFRILNIYGKSYKELDFCPQAGRFSKNVVEENGVRSRSDDGRYWKVELASQVIWPGNILRVPKGWAMPSTDKPLKIGIPGRTSFEKFVKVDMTRPTSEPTGFCIDVFKETVKILEQTYPLQYEFIPHNGTYDDLIDLVFNGTYDAVIGDVTILANRSHYVEFTQPYAESGLSVVVPVKSEDWAWIIFKPFTYEMWIVTGAMIIYTMLIVLVLEHHDNPEFSGRWREKLGTALYFTFSSLFFAHREKIQRNSTKIVLVVWLFAVFVLTSSYTASLSSMLTVKRLEASVSDIDWLRRTKSKIGCDGDSFVVNYLKEVLDFEEQNIIRIDSEDKYPEAFSSGNITAAFFEVPYTKVFLNQYCKKYTSIEGQWRFGGFGFVFPKGSPLTADFSDAILNISENGVLKKLEKSLFSSSTGCSTPDSSTDSLSLKGFWGLYLLTGATSTICFLIFQLGWLRQHNRNVAEVNRTLSRRSSRTVSGPRDADEWELVNPTENAGERQALPSVEVEMV